VVPLLPGFARRRVALKDQRKMASVNHPRCESTLPLTLSLSDSGIYFYPLARPAARRIRISFLAISLIFLFSDIAAPATSGRQAIAPPS
jgi:hypothetical protein